MEFRAASGEAGVEITFGQWVGWERVGLVFGRFCAV